jgi:hypothetical protein
MEEIKKTYCFVDESGDSSFYGARKKLLVGAEGFQPMLNLGMVTLVDKKSIREAIVQFMQQLRNDPLYNTIYSLRQPDWYLHARGDHPEVRAKFFEFLRNLDGFKCYIVIGRKRLSTFQNKHNNNEREFYFDLVYHLLKDRLNEEDKLYQIFLSARQKSTQENLGAAVAKAVERDNIRRKIPRIIQYKFDIVRSEDTPELSIADYLLWALNRYIINGEERFFKALQNKYNLIIDVYDFDKYNQRKGNYYTRNHLFSLENASEFRSDGYVHK